MMLQKKIIVILLLIISTLLYSKVISQTFQIDSLKNLIVNTKYDTTKIRLLNDLGIKYWNINPDYSIKIGKKTLNLAYKNQNFNQIARSYNIIGAAYRIKNEFDSACSNFLLARKNAEKYHHETDEIKSLHNLCSLYALGLHQNQIELDYNVNRLCIHLKKHKINYIILQAFLNIEGRSLSFKNENYDLIENLKKNNRAINPKKDTIIYILQSFRHLNNSEYNKAIYFANKALNKSDNLYILITCYEILVDSYINLRKYSEALILEKKILGLIQNSNDFYLKTKTNLNESKLGEIYVQLKDYKNAYKYCFKPLSEIHTPRNKAIIYNNIGKMYIGLDSLEKAEYWLEKAFEISENNNYYNELLNTLNSMIELYTLSENFQKTTTLVMKLENLIPKVSQLYNVFESYEILISYYRNLENYKKAFELSKKKDIVIYTINNRESNQLIEEVRLKHETAQKDLQIIQQKQLIVKKEKTIFLVSIIFLLLIVIILLFLYIQFQKERKKLLIQKKLENELQLNTLRTKIIPHFTKNVLSAIGHFAMTDKLKAGHYISVFSKFNGLTLANADKNYNSIKNEIEYIQVYLELEKMRFGDRFNYQITVNKNIDRNTLIPTMILHTYCDNAIRHGLVNKKETGILKIEIAQSNQGILITITDNGIGRKKAKEIGTQGEGQGLRLIDNQLEFYNQKNKHKIIQTITDLQNENGEALGTKIELHIPTMYSFE